MPILGPPRFCKWFAVQVIPKRKVWNPPFHFAHDFVGQAFRKRLSGGSSPLIHMKLAGAGGGILPKVGASPGCLVPLLWGAGGCDLLLSPWLPSLSVWHLILTTCSLFLFYSPLVSEQVRFLHGAGFQERSKGSHPGEG